MVYQQMCRWMADEQDRAQVADLVAQVQAVTSLPDTFGMGEESRPSEAMAQGRRGPIDRAPYTLT